MCSTLSAALPVACSSPLPPSLTPPSLPHHSSPPSSLDLPSPLPHSSLTPLPPQPPPLTFSHSQYPPHLTLLTLFSSLPPSLPPSLSPSLPLLRCVEDDADTNRVPENSCRENRVKGHRAIPQHSVSDPSTLQTSGGTAWGQAWVVGGV